MPPQTLDRLRETAVLKLDEVLTGVQPAEQRQTPMIPPALGQVAYSETVIDSRLATPDSLFVALSGEKVDGHYFLANASLRELASKTGRSIWSRTTSPGHAVAATGSSSGP